MNREEKKYIHNAWLLDTPSLSDFLKLAYSNDHYGEIWLFNNDLDALIQEDTFKSLYVDLIAKSLFNSVDAVKFILGNKEYNQITTDNKLKNNFYRISQLFKGKERLSTFYFAKIEDFNIPSDSNLLNETWVFYTHHGNLSEQGGVVMLRQRGFPFVVSNDPNKVTISWQLADHRILKRRLREKFEGYFNDNNKFKWLNVKHSEKDNFSFELKSELSPITKERNHKREHTFEPYPLLYNEKVDVAVITALRKEANAFEKVVSREKSTIRKTPFDNKRYAIIKTNNNRNFKVLISHLPDQGVIPATLITQEIISKYNPDYLILTGVCGGKEGKVGLGDVIIADQIYYYDMEKIKQNGKIENMHQSFSTGTQLKEIAKKVKEDLKGKIKGEQNKLKYNCTIHDEMVVASGSKLVLDPDFFNRLWSKSKLFTTEMEGAGFALACERNGKKEYILIKGVMDFCDENSREEYPEEKKLWKEIAAKTAAKFVLELIKEL